MSAVMCTAFLFGSVSAQESPLEFGINAGVNLSGAVYTGNTSSGGDNFGWGGGGGLTVRYSIAEAIKVRVEANFDYRIVGEDGYWGTEMAVCIPIRGYYHLGNWYVGLGLNVDIPFGYKSSDYWKSVQELLGKNYGIGDDDRASLDVGYGGGVGYMITPKLAVEINGNNNFTKMFSGGMFGDEAVSSHTESIKIIYFF
jgi:hypothetical protein